MIVRAILVLLIAMGLLALRGVMTPATAAHVTSYHLLMGTLRLQPVLRRLADQQRAPDPDHVSRHPGGHRPPPAHARYYARPPARLRPTVDPPAR